LRAEKEQGHQGGMAGGQDVEMVEAAEGDPTNGEEGSQPPTFLDELLAEGTGLEGCVLAGWVSCVAALPE